MNDRKRVTVGEVMRGDFIVMDGLMTVADAIVALRDQGAKELIVDKRDDEDEYGIVQLADIAKRVLAKDRAPERVNIYEIMTKPVVGVHPGMDVRYCSRLFLNFGIASVPVIDAGKVVGMVGYRELVLGGMI